MCEFHVSGSPTHFQEKQMENPVEGWSRERAFIIGSTQHHEAFTALIWVYSTQVLELGSLMSH